MFNLACNRRSGVIWLIAGLLALMPHLPLSADSHSTVDKLNVNQADVTALTYLPSIGPARAAQIINLRNARSKGFTTLEELLEVSGIGKKTLEKLRPYATVTGGVAAPTEAMLASQANDSKDSDESMDKSNESNESNESAVTAE